VHADLSSPEASLRAVAGVLACFGDAALSEVLVVNNAATLEPIGPASRKDSDALLASLNINFTSAIVVLAEVVRRFQADPCRKVLANVSSGAAQKGYAGWSLYCAAKAGLENYVRAVALEQQREAHPFIAINIDPGVIDTDMQAAVRASSPSEFPEVQRFIDRKKHGGLASPEQVAAAVCRILQLPALSHGARYDVREHAA
jgi:benzil reductase ((S)-benzoin forming)